MPIIDFKTNKALSAKEIKSRVMRATGWSDEQYRKQYDILRNKTRNYEQLTGASSKIKVNELLYEKTRAQQRYGAAYRPSRLLRAIEATPSLSTGTVKRGGVSLRATARLESEILGEFRGFTSKSAEGARIVNLYNAAKNPAFLEREINKLTTQAQQAEEDGDPFLAEILKQEADELRNAPKNIAELKKELTSAAKSLKEYQKNKRGEWRKQNPDAPADYAVGTP